MLSTDLIKRAQEDIEFKAMNIEKLQDQIVEFDDQKSLYDEGIVKIENNTFESSLTMLINHSILSLMHIKVPLTVVVRVICSGELLIGNQIYQLIFSS